MLTKSNFIQCFQNQQELYQVLLDVQQRCWKKKQEQIISISFEVLPIDPLVILDRFLINKEFYFYFRQRVRPPHPPFNFNGTTHLNPLHPSELKDSDSLTQGGWEMAAIGLVPQVELEKDLSQIKYPPSDSSCPTQFDQAKTLIQASLAKTISIGRLDLPLSGPHFFCSFNFFDRKTSLGVPSRPYDDQRYPKSTFPTAIVFMPQWQIVRHHHHSLVVTNHGISVETNIHFLASEIWEKLHLIQHLHHKLIIPCPKNYGLEKRDVVSEEQFIKGVNSALHAIESQQLHKVVLAHALDVTSPKPFQLVACLENTRSLHPDCAVFAIGNGQGQNFIGATPERLMSITNDGLFVDALAGSAPRGGTTMEDDWLGHHLMSSQKELHEHQVVVDFISQQLINVGLTPQRSPVPTLLKLNHIQHLQTLIQSVLPTYIHPFHILEVLHPTPAVAGDPQQIACQLIRQYEPFERTLYAAPLGWIDYQGNCEFVVGIRSAMVGGNHARLFAGAGIVAGSNPNREWAEIQLKLKTLLDVLV